MEFEFLNPINKALIAYAEGLTSQQIGGIINLHTPNNFPDTKTTTIAILGVLENRGNPLKTKSINLDAIRKNLYDLYYGNWNLTIADFGDILEGETIEDTYFLVKKIVANLMKKEVIPIIIGGSQDLTYALYRGFDQLEQMVNLVSIDNRFDFGKEENLQHNSYLSKIILDEPNNLFNYSNIGYQTYYNSQEEIDLIDKLFFESYRLGEISNNIALAEPVLRDADLVSIDLTSTKSADSGSVDPFEPNGFDGKEICALARYAGISDKVTVLGIFNHNDTHQEAGLISQIIWYFIEGIQHRSKEYPFGSRINYLKYIVPIEEENLIFYKSDKTDRWWIEIPYDNDANNKLGKNTLLPCSYEEYLAACNQDIPERWWKAQRKNIF